MTAEVGCGESPLFFLTLKNKVGKSPLFFLTVDQHFGESPLFFLTVDQGCGKSPLFFLTGVFVGGAATITDKSDSRMNWPGEVIDKCLIPAQVGSIVRPDG